MSSPFKGATAVQTHGAILDLIRSSGVVSRTELVDRSGLTGASITRIVRQLLDDGLITEIGSESQLAENGALCCSSTRLPGRP